MALTTVPSGMISSVAGSTLTGTIPNSAIPSGSVVQVAYDQIVINGTRATQTYVSSTTITPVASYSKVYIHSTVYLRAPYAYGTYGTYDIQATIGLSGLSDATAYRNSLASAANAGSQISSSNYISAGGSVNSICVYTKNTGSWTTSDVFQYAYTVGPVYGGTYWDTIQIAFYLVK